MSGVDRRKFTPEDAAGFTAPTNGNGESRLASHMVLPGGYQAPSRTDVVDRLNESGMSYKGKVDFGAVATGPTVLPLALGEELAHLGDSMRVGFGEIKTILKGGGTKDERRKTQSILTANAPKDVQTDPATLSKQPAFLMRPDVVVMSEGNRETGVYTLRTGIGEIETRPAGTMIVPTLMDAYGLDPEPYHQAWADEFRGKPWAAVIPEEWAHYRPELEAFGRAYAEHGGEFAGTHMVDRMTHDELDRAIPERSYVYGFGYTDVFDRSGSLDKVRGLAARSDVIVYNPMDYHLETKAALTVMKQPWFLERVSDRVQGGDEHAERLDRWLTQSLALSVRAEQDVNWHDLIKNRKNWVLKRAGFDIDATEARGLVMPSDPGGEERFVRTLEQALSGDNGQWMAQEYMQSKIPQEYYHPETGEVDVFRGAARLTPIYLTRGKHRTDMLGGINTVSYGSDKAHGGSGERKVAGMAVMSPIVFDETPNLVYSAKR